MTGCAHVFCQYISLILPIHIKLKVVDRLKILNYSIKLFLAHILGKNYTNKSKNQK